MILFESLIVAAVSTVLGFLGGIGVSKLLVVIFNSVGAGFPDAATIIQWRTIAFAVLVGFGVTLLSTIVPALRASHIPPIAAMRPELAAHDGTTTRRRVVGAVVALVGLALYLTGILAKPGGTMRDHPAGRRGSHRWSSWVSRCWRPVSPVPPAASSACPSPRCSRYPVAWPPRTRHDHRIAPRRRPRPS